MDTRFANVVENVPQIALFETLKTATSEEEILTCIRQGRLPYEAVTGVIKPTVVVWEELMRQMPIFALTRHLVTLDESGVFRKKSNVDYVVSQLTNREKVERSRMLPFRFYSAYIMFNGDQRIKEALNTALNLSFTNMPVLKGKTVVAVDVSGSMTSMLSDKSKMSYMAVGSVLGGALFLKSTDCMPLAFASACDSPRFLRSDSLLSITERFLDMASKLGGGTDITTVFQRLLARSEYADQIIVVTDMQSWQEWTNGNTFYGIWRQYKQRINPNVKVFWVNVASYGNRPTDPNTSKEQNIYYIHGWNDSVLQFIQMQIEGNKGLIEGINGVAL